MHVLNYDLGRVRRVASQPIAKITTDDATGEATKKRLVFGKSLSLSATTFQGSAMAATGEQRDKLCSHAHCSIVPSVTDSACISTYTKARLLT